MATKKKIQVSQDGELRDATDEEIANLQLIQQDAAANPPAWAAE